MLRHIVMLTWHVDASQERIDAFTTTLGTLPEQIPEIRRFAHGADAKVGAGRCDYVVVADFDDAAGYRTYHGHPAHQALREVLGPILASRAVIEFELPG